MQTPFDRRDNNIAALRMVLAVLVLYSHSYGLSGAGLADPFSVFDRYQEAGGGIAVDLFFVLSGFLITASYERSASAWDYLLKRVRRIYPGFVVAMLASVVFVLPCSGGHMAEATRSWRCLDFVTQTLRLREYHYTGAFPRNPVQGFINGSSWSISYEFWCYLGLLLLGLVGLLRSRRFLAGLFLTVTALGFLFTFPSVVAVFNRHYWNRWTILLDEVFGYTPLWAHVLPMYLAGVLYYRFRAHLSIRWVWIAAACATVFAACRIPHAWHLLFPLAGGYLFLVLAFHPEIHLHRWARFGDLSYGIYLYAYPVQQLVMQSLGHPVGPWLLFGLSLPLTLLCAIGSWYLVERRFLGRLPSAHSRPEGQGSSSRAAQEEHGSRQQGSYP